MERERPVMTQRLIPLIFLLVISLFSVNASVSLFGQNSNSQFAPVNQAFIFNFSQKNDQLMLGWQVKPGYYLYRQQIKISVQGATLAQWELPAGKPHEDEFYGKTEIYPDSLMLPFTIEQGGDGSQMTVTYQGCAAAGFCYPPETRSVPLNSVAAHSSAPAPAPSAAVSAAPETRSDNALPFSPLWALLIGIGVAFTPCMLPMYPLISGIILGGNRQYHQYRLFALAMVYVQGMALTYTVMGIVVAAAGLRFQAALQAPAVLMVLSALFIVLALSMFGLFSLQLPSSLQTRLMLWSNRQPGGALSGVFLMGALSGLICSPCTTAPLSAMLLYIAQRDNMLAGGGILYLYALGMGLPLIAITLFGNRLLPKRGPWMQTVKEGFGFVILALPVFLLKRVIGDAWSLRLWSALGVVFFGWAFISSLKANRGWLRVLQILLLGAMLIAARPLQDWAFGNALMAESAAHLSFNRISSVEQLNQQLQSSAGKITMLDLYADWCVACKEFEKYTFSDGQVQSALGQLQLLQADVTVNNAAHSALLQHLNVLGLPTILFFDASGREIPSSRVTGLMKPAAFRTHLQKLAR